MKKIVKNGAKHMNVRMSPELFAILKRAQLRQSLKAEQLVSINQMVIDAVAERYNHDGWTAIDVDKLLDRKKEEGR
jgi:predicted HicB family RNase H-like nuclease